MPVFYKQLLLAWQDFRSLSSPNTSAEIRSELLWYNNYIRIDSQPIFFQSWYQKGIKYIHDLVDEHGHFKTIDQLTEEYGITTNFLEYLGVRTAIPLHWRTLIRNVCPLINTEDFIVKLKNSSKNIKDLKCKDFTKVFIDNKPDVKPTAESRWTEVYGDTVDFQAAYITPFASTFESRLQAFQFSMLHRYTVCNVKLSQMCYCQQSRV
jgi:hypothetical protein